MKKIYAQEIRFSQGNFVSVWRSHRKRMWDVLQKKLIERGKGFMSMISPQTFRTGLQKDTYKDLIKKRDELMRSIKRFEKAEASGERMGAERDIVPAPEVRYQVNLEYLSEVCSLMSEKHNEDYVWGERRLSDDL